MNISGSFKRKSFGIIGLYMIVLSGVVCAAVYFLMGRFIESFSPETGGHLLEKNASVWFDYIALAFKNYFIWCVPAVFLIFMVLGTVGWLMLSFSMASVIKQINAKIEEKQKTRAGKKEFIDHRIEKDRKQRLFLHSLAVLQREGRLLDFFDEDLSAYGDEQIGAAVRSIQEDCKRAVKKYIDLRPVIDSQEGEVVTVESGFDRDAISLVGNVAGDPPFEGILKHRGWKAGKKEIPKLADIRDAGIITPAEIELR